MHSQMQIGTELSCGRAQVNYSMMVGAILSWGFAWPLVRNRAGDWYPILPATTASYSFQGARRTASCGLSAARLYLCPP